jgi:hypothetical protein
METGKRFATSLAFLALQGCASTISGSTYTDGRFWFSNVKSASDVAGGPRQDLIVVVDRDGRVVETFTASGIGTFQAVTSGLSAAVVSASGQAVGSALIRPARNTTNVRMDVQGTGGSGCAGGNNTVDVSGTGGAGGSGSGNATATATGGNATSGTAVSP